MPLLVPRPFESLGFKVSHSTKEEARHGRFTHIETSIAISVIVIATLQILLVLLLKLQPLHLPPPALPSLSAPAAATAAAVATIPLLLLFRRRPAFLNYCGTDNGSGVLLLFLAKCHVPPTQRTNHAVAAIAAWSWLRSFFRGGNALRCKLNP